jgi:hypothetical protein
MITDGLARGVINQRVGRIVRAFKWAGSEELVPAAIYQSLKTVSGLQRGRTTAREGLEEANHLVEGADLGAADDLPGLAEHADGDALAVDVEPDVEHGRLLKSLYRGNAATEFQVARLTEASFIASTPTLFGGCFGP